MFYVVVSELNLRQKRHHLGYFSRLWKAHRRHYATVFTNWVVLVAREDLLMPKRGNWGVTWRVNWLWCMQWVESPFNKGPRLQCVKEKYISLQTEILFPVFYHFSTSLYLFWVLCAFTVGVFLWSVVQKSISCSVGIPRHLPYTAVLFFLGHAAGNPGSTVLCTSSYFEHDIDTFPSLLCHTPVNCKKNYLGHVLQT